MLTDEQQSIQDSILHWLDIHLRVYGRHDPTYQVVGGYAGTGKTYLISQLRNAIHEKFKHINVAFVTFTGKASSVLKTRLLENDASYAPDYVGTIHRLIYKPKFGYDPDLKRMVIVGWEKTSALDYDLIIIDEASMVGENVWKDLLSYDNPIIAFGDHGQLPPIGDTTFYLMKYPNYVLNEIHRQAANSPIIKLSKFVRENGYIPEGVFSQDPFVAKLSWNSDVCKRFWNGINFDEEVIVLCGFNQTRLTLNNMIRTRLKYTLPEPYPGERLVCLKNNMVSKIMNGQQGTVLWSMPHRKGITRMTIDMDGYGSDFYEGLIHEGCFNIIDYHAIMSQINYKKINKMVEGTEFSTVDFFDFGYALSVHKSQGSEWDKVVLFEQRTKRWDDDYYKRWLYTAVTRSREKLFIISDFW